MNPYSRNPYGYPANPYGHQANPIWRVSQWSAGWLSDVSKRLPFSILAAVVVENLLIARTFCLKPRFRATFEVRSCDYEHP